MATKREKKPYIVCGARDGQAVIFGWSDSEPEVGVPIKLHNARMVLYYSEKCGGLFGLATRGPQDGTRITCTVEVAGDTCRQVLTVTKEAAKRLAEWPDA